MPGFDGRGPERKGPYGRRLGPCSDNERRNISNFLGFGRGRRGGWRGFWWDAREVVDHKTVLQEEKQRLIQKMKIIDDRLQDLGED